MIPLPFFLELHRRDNQLYLLGLQQTAPPNPRQQQETASPKAQHASFQILKRLRRRSRLCCPPCCRCCCSVLDSKTLSPSPQSSTPACSSSSSKKHQPQLLKYAQRGGAAATVAVVATKAATRLPHRATWCQRQSRPHHAPENCKKQLLPMR